MVVSVGIDIVALTRVNDALVTGGDDFLDAVFTASERESIARNPMPLAKYSMLFGAKEAVFKALAATWADGAKLSDIEIRDGDHGQPIPVLSGYFLKLAEERSVSDIQVSLSWGGDLAVAVAIVSTDSVNLPLSAHQ